MANQSLSLLYPASLDDADSLGRVTNNAISTLAADYGAAAGVGTTFSVQAGDGAKFPTTGIASIYNLSGSAEVTMELIAYERSGDVFTTKARGLYGTTVNTHLAASPSYVECRVLAAHHETLRDAIIQIERRVGTSNSPALGPEGFPSILPNATFVTVLVSNLAVGNNDIYTPAAGKKAVVVSGVVSFIVAAQTTYLQIKVAGNYYRAGTGTVIGSAGSSSQLGIGYVLDSTMTLSLNVASNGGNNVWVTLIEFDDTFPLKTVRLNGVGAGANTLYTVPNGKVAHVYGSAWNNFNSPQIVGSNDSGATRSVTVNVVPSGGIAGTSNQLTSSVSITNGNTLSIACPGVLNAGDSIQITPDATTAVQAYWVTVLER